MSTRPLIRLDSTDVEVIHRGLKVSLASILDKIDEDSSNSKVRDEIQELHSKVSSCADEGHDHGNYESDIEDIKFDVKYLKDELDRPVPEDKIADLAERVSKLEKILEGI
jgi:hypothetical protein